MGLDNTSVRYHFHLKKLGYSFRKVAMLGRQEFFGVSSKDLISNAAKFGMKMSPEEAEKILVKHNGYAEEFYFWLGAEVVDSFDASDYESATQMWDMNEPLPDRHRDNYDFVFDGGTLEHVFNYPSALRESLTLSRENGLFFSATPSDSYLGHGLYQFSPDLAFEILNPRNGYSNLGVYLVEQTANPVFYEISSPTNRGRTEVSTSQPTLMFWCGQRTSEVPTRLTVYQPDYSSAWKAENSAANSAHPLRNIAGKAFCWLPPKYKHTLLRVSKQVINIFSQNSLWDRAWAKRSDEI